MQTGRGQRLWCGMRIDEGTVVAPPTGGEAPPDRADQVEPAPGSPPPGPGSHPLLARRYRLGRRIGKGGMGEVPAQFLEIAHTLAGAAGLGPSLVRRRPYCYPRSVPSPRPTGA